MTAKRICRAACRNRSDRFAVKRSRGRRISAQSASRNNNIVGIRLKDRRLIKVFTNGDHDPRIPPASIPRVIPLITDREIIADIGDAGRSIAIPRSVCIKVGNIGRTEENELIVSTGLGRSLLLGRATVHANFKVLGLGSFPNVLARCGSNDTAEVELGVAILECFDTVVHAAPSLRTRAFARVRRFDDICGDRVALHLVNGVAFLTFGILVRREVVRLFDVVFAEAERGNGEGVDDERAVVVVGRAADVTNRHKLARRAGCAGAIRKDIRVIRRNAISRRGNGNIIGNRCGILNV